MIDPRRLWLPALTVFSILVPSGSLLATSPASSASVSIRLAQAETGKQSGGAPPAEGRGKASGTVTAPGAKGPAVGGQGAGARGSGSGRDSETRTTTRQRSGGDVPAAKGAVERRITRDRQVDRPVAPPRVVETPRVRSDGQRARVNNDRDRDRNRRRGTRFYWGPGAEYFFFDGYYHGDCAWLRRKARETGSRYWQQRYRQCREW